LLQFADGYLVERDVQLIADVVPETEGANGSIEKNGSI
jgi:hypothetical protein